MTADLLPPGKRSGVAIVICAPSGTGKTTLGKRLLAECPSFFFSVSCTTRPPRECEVDGKDYHFLTPEEFESLRDQGYFAEWAFVHGNYYGTPLAASLEALKLGRDLLFDIDVQGAAQLKKTIPDALFVFILPPSRAILEIRLRGRGTETQDSFAERLYNAKEELKEASWFDIWIVNNNIDNAYSDLRAVFRAATLAPCRRPNLVNTLLEEWE